MRKYSDNLDGVVALEKRDEITIGYMGTLRKETIFILGKIIRALNMLKTQNIRFYFRCSASRRLKAELMQLFRNEYTIEKLVFQEGFIPFKEVVSKEFPCIDIFLEVENRDALQATGKIFYYLAAKKPIMAFGLKDNIGLELVKKARCGETFEFNCKVTDIKSVLEECLSGENFSAFAPDTQYIESLSSYNQAKIIDEVLVKLSSEITSKNKPHEK